MKQQARNQSNQIARECMVSALMQLLETKPLSTISVTEITKKAGVSRMTYYRNYHSKEEIFSSYLTDIIASYKADASAWNMEGSYNDQRHMQHCFQYFYTHKDFIRCLIKSGLGDLLLKALSGYMIDTYYTPGAPMSEYYTLEAFAGSLYNIYLAWIENNTAESAEDMAAIMCGIFSSF